MPRENLWKFGVIAAALGGAAVISFFSWSSDAAPPDDGGRVTYWSCAECGHGFQLSIDEFKADAAQEILDDLGVEDFSSGPLG